MWHLGTWPSGGWGTAEQMVGFNELKLVFFNPNDSIGL